MNEDIYSKSKRSKKYLLTFTEETHAEIKKQLRTMTGIIYWGMCDDLGSVDGSTVIHTHLFVSFQSGVSMEYMKDMFPTAVIVSTSCSYRDARDYVLGKVIFFEGDDALCKEDVFEEYYAFEEEVPEPQKEVPEPQPHFIERHSTVISWLIMLLGLVLAVMIGCMKVNAAEDFTFSEVGTFTYNGVEYPYYYVSSYQVNIAGRTYDMVLDSPAYGFHCGNNYNFVSFTSSNKLSWYLNGEYITCNEFYGYDTYGFCVGGLIHGNHYGSSLPDSGTYVSGLEKAFYAYVASEEFVEYEEPKPNVNTLDTDSGYSLINFTADNKINASWAGTYKGDIVVEDAYLDITFIYASAVPDYILTDTLSYESKIDTSNLSFYIPWENVQNENTDLYLRTIVVVPVGIDASGNYVKGVSSSVILNEDGSINEISASTNSFTTLYDEIVHGGGGNRRGVEYLSDFYLKNVIVKQGTLSLKDVIQWEGCTNNIDYLIVPDSDTLVICTVVLYDINLDIVVEAYDYTTIGSGSMVVDIEELKEKYSELEYLWNGEVRLTPSYKIDNKLYIGQQTSINLFDGSVLNEGIDEEGNFVIEDVTDSNISNSNKDTIFDNAADYMNDPEALAKYTSLFFGFLSNLVALMGDLPSIFAAVFSFLPAFYTNLIGMIFVIALVCRFLGR